MPVKGLGRDGRKVTKCMYKGRESDCPAKCDECAIPLRAIADAALRNGDVDASLSFYRKAVELKPDYVEAWNNMASLLGALMRFSESLDAYSRALAVDPSYGRAMKGRATSLMNLMRYDEAMDQLDEAMGQYDDELLFREKDELRRRMGLYGDDWAGDGYEVLRFAMEWLVDNGHTDKPSVVFVRRVWNRAAETVMPVFSRSLKASAGALTERDAYVAALASCVDAGRAVAIINETVTDKQLSDADYDKNGFFRLLPAEIDAMPYSAPLARKAIVEYRNVSGMAEWERESGQRATARDYAVCAVALFLAGACVVQHEMGRW